jgi:peptidoglycan hydrolase CwlO-like protein
MLATLEAEIIIGECECGTCGRVYDFEATGAECSDQCPGCAAIEEEQARAADAREEAIADAQGDLEEAESDLEGLLAELAEIRERIAEAKAAVKASKGKLARLMV